MEPTQHKLDNKRLRSLGALGAAQTTLIFGAACLVGTNAPAVNAQVQHWDTDYGRMQISPSRGNHWSGTYLDGKASILGSKDSRGYFSGHWIRSDQSSKRCSYLVNGSYYWGHVQINFGTNSFSGKYRTCDDHQSSNWNGTIVGTSSRNPGDGPNLEGFFSPSLEKPFVTNYGILRFSKHGSQTIGTYGRNGQIAVDQEWWREAPKKEVEYKGRWRLTDGRNGEFQFNFETSCVFRGTWWHQSKPNNKKPWHGICVDNAAAHNPKDPPSFCCKAATAGCAAQCAGLTTEKYCVKNPNKIGCPFKQNR